MKFKRKLERSLSFRRSNHRNKPVNRLEDTKKFWENEENMLEKSLHGNKISNSKPVTQNAVYFSCHHTKCQDSQKGNKSVEMTCSNFESRHQGKNEITDKHSELSNRTPSFVHKRMNSLRDNVMKNSAYSFPRKTLIGRVRHSKKSDVKFNKKDTLNKRLLVAAKSGFFSNVKDALGFSTLVRSVSFSKKSGHQNKETEILRCKDTNGTEETKVEGPKKQSVRHPETLKLPDGLKQTDTGKTESDSKLVTKSLSINNYESLPFEAHSDLSPTCADIYGVDEVDNSLFDKFGDISEISKTSEVDPNGIKDKSSDDKRCTEGTVTAQVDCDACVAKDKSDKHDTTEKNEWMNFCNGINLDIQHEIKVNNNTSKEADHSMYDENPWVKQVKPASAKELKSDMKGSYQSDGDILETSLGFEVNTSLRRSDSSCSIDSFGSSVHSVKDVYFSDSEAEHNINESSSDSETNKAKQIIPYSLAENVDSQNVTVRKKKDLHSKSFDDNSAGSTKEPLKASLFKSISLGFNEEKPKRKAKHERRSLDSSLMQRDILSNDEAAQWKKKMKSGSTEYLSPVLENKVPKDSSKTKDDKTKDLDPNRFFTLPNPKKLRSQQQNLKRKLGRLGSVSKILSDRAHSLSNLKIGASFKLRKEIEKSKSLVSSSATSLSDMMTKKASSLTTLIRRRTNSNTAVESPFKQYGKKRTKTKKEDQTELVYERVCIKVSPSRPATALEDLARLKRLKVTLKLARTLSLNEDDNKYIDSRSRSSSMVGRPLNSESSNSLRSPTFLDEMMKSVDAARVKQLCSFDNDEDDDLSDCEESSSGSSLLLFQKQYSFDSECTDSRSVKDSSLITVCRSCGKIRSLSSDSGSDSFETPMNKPSIGSTRYAMSLCDLNSKCLCVKRKHTHKRFSAVIDSDTFKLNNGLSAVGGSSDIILGSGRSEILSCDSSTPRKRLSHTGQRPTSMYDVRGFIFSDWDYDKSMNDIDETDSREDIDASNALPGALHRHRPLLDLSGENLDVTIDSEDGIIGAVDADYAQRSQSCGDLIDSEKYFGKGIALTEIAKSMGKKNSAEYDLESNHSMFESVTTEKDLEDNTETLSRSCSDLLDTNTNIEDKDFRDEEQRKKELRKVKVKSMSSSHDALSVLVPMGTVDIDDIDFDGCLNQNSLTEVKIGSPNTVHDNTVNAQTKINDLSNDIKKFVNDSNEKNESISVPKTCDKEDTSDSKNLLKSSRKPVNDNPDIICSKPPLPHKKHSNRVLSLSDLSHSDSAKTKVPSDIPKRYSMIELDKENLNALIWVSDNDLVRKKKQKKRHRTVLGMSDELNTPKSAISLRTPVSKFLFDENQVQNYLKSVSISDKPKSVSSDNISSADSMRQLDRDRLTSARSLRQLSTKTSTSDEVFNRLSFPAGLPYSPFADTIETTSGKPRYSDVTGFSSKDIHGFTSPGYLPELPTLTEDCVYKYDICLGYLLHSVQCDNMMVCFYSPQRNKQLMESVITPLSSTSHSPHRKVSDHGNPSKNKVPNKPKIDELPNPAAPITNVPSERLVHAGHVLRTVLLARAPHMIRDRKFHLRTYRRCMVGTEMVDWLSQQSTLVHSRTQAVGMWQALVEEGIVVHVCHEHQFKDKYLFYRFQEDDEGVSTVPSNTTKRECEEDLPDIFLLLAHIGPDAMMRMILRKLPHERTSEDLEIIYEELLHIKALSHLSTMVKRELASVLLFESHAKAGTVLFNQGDEGKSWYIVLKGSVNVVIYGKGVVCTLHEGDDFGKLALVNDAPRAATIVLRDNNCHFLRVDKDDFNRILRDVEANTVRLKEHGQDVLVLEKIPSNSQCSDGTIHAHYKYSVMAGTPEKMLEHLLESRLDNKHVSEIDEFLEDFLLTHVIYMPCNHLCPVLLSHYHSSTADVTEQESIEFMLNHKRCVLHFVQEWANIVGVAFKEDYTINAFLEELNSCVMDDLQDYPSLKDDIASLENILTAHKGSPNNRLKKRASGTFTLSRKSSKECFQDSPKKRKSISASQETIIKVYCADHTYTTVKLAMDAKVEQILMQVRDKLGLGDDLLLCEVKSTGERLVLKENDLGITTSISINSQLFVTPKEHLDALTPLPEQTSLSEGTFSVIEIFSSREMAYHMTLYDWELFTCVQEYELIYQVFGRYKFGKITSNLDLFLRRFNEIQFWIVTEMVLTSNLSKRVSLLRKFIKLAALCKEYRNLNCFFAIVMGLSNIAVSRLSQTWEKLPSKFKKMFADFETLMDPSRNHRVYRLSVAKMAPPIIPFMPLLMKDMTFTHEGNKTYFDGLVNFEKMHMIAQTLKTVRFCRSTHLDIEAPGTLKSSDTADYIRNIKVIDNQRLLTQLSHKLEPRRT